MGLSHWLTSRWGDRGSCSPGCGTEQAGGITPALCTAAACVILVLEPDRWASSAGHRCWGTRFWGLCPGFLASVGLAAVLNGLFLSALQRGHGFGEDDPGRDEVRWGPWRPALALEGGGACLQAHSEGQGPRVGPKAPWPPSFGFPECRAFGEGVRLCLALC